MYNTTIQTLATRANVVGAIASLLTLIGAGATQAVPINSTPGAITCKVGSPGHVGGDFSGFFDPELNNNRGGIEIDLGALDEVGCGPNLPGIDDPPPLRPLPEHPVCLFCNVALRLPGENDLVLHGRYILGGMYGFFNNGEYGVYNLHGVYDVQGILFDATVYNFDRFGVAHPPIAVPEPVAGWLLGSGLLGLLGVARRKR